MLFHKLLYHSGFSPGLDKNGLSVAYLKLNVQQPPSNVLGNEGKVFAHIFQKGLVRKSHLSSYSKLDRYLSFACG